jgi:hypothetical protein
MKKLIIASILLAASASALASTSAHKITLVSKLLLPVQIENQFPHTTGVAYTTAIDSRGYAVQADANVQSMTLYPSSPVYFTNSKTGENLKIVDGQNTFGIEVLSKRFDILGTFNLTGKADYKITVSRIGSSGASGQCIPGKQNKYEACLS